VQEDLNEAMCCDIKKISRMNCGADKSSLEIAKLSLGEFTTFSLLQDVAYCEEHNNTDTKTRLQNSN
jgi:hypothetical protein